MLYFIIYYLNGNCIPLMLYLNFSSIVFFIGMVGIIWNKRNILIMLLCIELMFFGISLNFIFFSIYMFNNIGQILCLFILTVTAGETAIGLSLLIILLRLGNKITYNFLINLRH